MSDAGSNKIFEAATLFTKITYLSDHNLTLPPVQDQPIPYDFQYGVKDDYSGAYFSQTEESDGNAVTGNYIVQLPDGRKQNVTTFHTILTTEECVKNCDILWSIPHCTH